MSAALYHYRRLERGVAVRSEIVCLIHLQKMKAVMPAPDSRLGIYEFIKEYQGEYPCRLCYREERRWA